MKLCVVGSSMLGLVTAACMASKGYAVAVAETADIGDQPFSEVGLEAMVVQQVAAGSLVFQAELDCAMVGAAWVVIAMDLPIDAQDRGDVSPVIDVVKRAAPHLGGAHVLVSAPVPVGTCHEIQRIVGRPICYAPENLRRGSAIARFLDPDFIVLGADNPATAEEAEKLFRWAMGPKIRTGLVEAEMVKHALNAFLASCIGYSCEIAQACKAVGVDPRVVLSAVRLDRRVGNGAPIAPLGGLQGGHIGRDCRVLQALGKEHRYPTHMIDGIFAASARANGPVIYWCSCRACGGESDSALCWCPNRGWSPYPGQLPLEPNDPKAAEIRAALASYKARLGAAP